MVWARIHHSDRTALVGVAGALTGIRYRDEILQHQVIPHMNINGGMFHHDNARPHVARVSHEFLPAPQRQDITVACPFAGLKSNRIFVGCTGSACAAEESTTQTLPRLLTALCYEWQYIPPHIAQRFIASTRRRCQAVLRARGGYNQYRHVCQPLCHTCMCIFSR